MGLFSRKQRPALEAAPGLDSLIRPDEVDESYELVEPQAVITHLRLSDDQFGSADEREAIFALEGRIVEAVAKIGCDHDGNEFGGGEVALFTYGPDADELFAVIQASLRDFAVRPGSYAIKRYGPVRPGVREERVELAQQP
jgi:hypothetical protein